MAEKRSVPHSQDGEIDVNEGIAQLADSMLELMKIKQMLKDHAGIAGVLARRAAKAEADGDVAMREALRGQAIAEYTAMIDLVIYGLAHHGGTGEDDEEAPSGRVFD